MQVIQRQTRVVLLTQVSVCHQYQMFAIHLKTNVIEDDVVSKCYTRMNVSVQV